MLLSSFSEDLRWWQRGVTYQVYPRSFKDTNNDGIGDLQGVIEKLDYLNDGTPNSLGIDALWLSPFYPSPMADFGYDVSNYVDVHPMFGDLATFDRLVNEAHRRNIKVIIDYVPNHTSSEHAWFVESRSSRDNRRRDWYIWRDARPDGSPPNNWGSVFGGPAWAWDEKTGQYYFHHFLAEQPDLNWRNSDVRAAMLDVLRFWLDRGVDGFRMDVVGMILKDPDFRDNPVNEAANPNLPANDLKARLKNVYSEDLDEVHEIIRDFRSLLDSYGDRCCIGEVWNELPRWVKYYGEQGDGLHLPFNFRLIGEKWEAAAIRKSVDEMEATLPSFAWPNYVLGNHDVPRLASRVGLAQARIAAMLLLTLRGTPTLYYGDELGMENGMISPDEIQDPQGINLGPERTRDVARTPMQWEASQFAGFSNVKPWLPVSSDYKERNVEVEKEKDTSMLNLYRRLLHLRRERSALRRGSYRPVEGGHKSCFLYLREDKSEKYLVALNFSHEPCSVSVPYERGRILLSTHLDREEDVTLNRLQLRADEGVLIEMK